MFFFINDTQISNFRDTGKQLQLENRGYQTNCSERTTQVHNIFKSLRKLSLTRQVLISFLYNQLFKAPNGRSYYMLYAQQGLGFCGHKMQCIYIHEICCMLQEGRYITNAEHNSDVDICHPSVWRVACGCVKRIFFITRRSLRVGNITNHDYTYHPRQLHV